MKDCQCLTHDGPHWLHMDFLDRERNLAYLERFVLSVETRNADDFLPAWEAWRRAEEARLQEKRRNMEREDARRGEPGEYSYSTLGIDGRVEAMEQRRRDLLARLERAAIMYEQARKDKRALCQAEKKEKEER